MPPNTLRVHTEYVLVKSVGPKVLWAESRVQGTGEYIPPLQSHCKILMGKSVVSPSIVPFGEYRRANSYCHLYGGSRLMTGILLASCDDEFCVPRSDYVKQVALETTITAQSGC
ncbi:uncharacterized protein TNCV_1677421 [Trichonephila clavipes]|nr:uncharacterized protein TNCV_1677421 [Trichonephila clavipes]